MSLVVSDTSPIHYLVLCGAIDVLPRLFERVIIPRSVFAELQHERTPTVVRDWISSLPTWATVQAGPAISTDVPIDPGEREAIGLAVEIHAAGILIDDREGRRVARQHGLIVIGTLGVLEVAAARYLIDFPTIIQKLRETNMRLDEQIVTEALQRDAERKRQPPK